MWKREKTQFLVFALVNFVRWLFQRLFLIGTLVIYVSQICLLTYVEIICILKRLNLKILFILNRDQKITGHTPGGRFSLSLIMGIVEKIM